MCECIRASVCVRACVRACAPVCVCVGVHVRATDPNNHQNGLPPGSLQKSHLAPKAKREDSGPKWKLACHWLWRHVTQALDGTD